MYILFIADTHDGLDLSDIKYCLGRLEPDCIIGLGDIGLNDYKLLCSEYNKIRIGGILGNHDGKDLFKVLNRFQCPVYDLNKQYFKMENSTFICLSGALKYKDDDTHAFLTQEECSRLMSTAPKADILLTHDKPADDSIGFNPHGGLIGIRDYIYEKQPLYNIHGHLHEQYVQQIDNTTEICVYKYCLCELTNYGKPNIRIINQV